MAMYVAMLAMLLTSYFVIGPLMYGILIDPMKPYILVDKNEYLTALSCQSKTQKQCDLPPVLPIEMTNPNSQHTIKLPVDSVPQEYLPYIHYPDNWDNYWNIFQPNGIGPVLKTILNITTPLLGILTIVYGIWLWKKGKFKKFLENLKP